MIVVIVVAVVAIATAIVALSTHKKGAVNSYEACAVSKGSTILTTYPETCVTTGGQRFTKTQ